RNGAGAASLEGRGYLLFGRNLAEGRCDEYDASADVWVLKGSTLGHSLHWPAVSSSSRGVHSFAGLRSDNALATQFNQRYDPGSDSWSTGIAMPEPPRLQAASISL